MYLEKGRALVQGIMILAFVAVAVFIDVTVGLILVTIMGILRLQQSVTDWCVPDPFLRWLGMKKKWEDLQCQKE
jgi:hypothetical protein